MRSKLEWELFHTGSFYDREPKPKKTKKKFGSTEAAIKFYNEQLYPKRSWKG